MCCGPGWPRPQTPGAATLDDNADQVSLTERDISVAVRLAEASNPQGGYAKEHGRLKFVEQALNFQRLSWSRGRLTSTQSTGNYRVTRHRAGAPMLSPAMLKAGSEQLHYFSERQPAPSSLISQNKGYRI